MDEIAVALRTAYPHALGTLIRVFGDVDFSEDALQEAALRALDAWNDRGIPEAPVAWLVRSARNYAVDLYRRRQLHDRHSDRILEVFSADGSAWQRIESDAYEPVKDDVLRLMFTYCHPSLPPESRVILTLKAIAGLTVREIANAFLVGERTMEQRITRAKRRLREEGIPFSLPEAEDLPARMDSVLSVIYLTFNEGYKASDGNDGLRPSLAVEAIRMARLLCELFDDEPEVSGLLALLLLHHSRAGARLNTDGDLVPLAEEDRDRWDLALMEEGTTLLQNALNAGRPGSYQIQAAIAAVHVSARSVEETDWVEIESLYRLLEKHAPSPVVTLNRAVALSRVRGPQAALDLLAGIAGTPVMERYHPFYVALGEFRHMLGDVSGAQTALQKALTLVQNDRERDFISNRLAVVGHGRDGVGKGLDSSSVS